MYFKKFFLEMESEWNVHKKIIEISNEKGGLRKQIPKSCFYCDNVNFNPPCLDFPFFYVDFNCEKGYAHVVEKEYNFDKLMHHVNLFVSYVL